MLTAFFLILSALQKGSVKIPKSALLISCGAIVLIWLASALSSGNAGLSLAGNIRSGHFFRDIRRFAGFVFGSMIFQSEKEPFLFLFAIVLLGFRRVSFPAPPPRFGINIIPFNIFPYNTSNLIGGWNDFSIFFGFIGLSSLVFLETAKLGKGMKFFLYILLLMSFLAMISANFFNNWVIFGTFSLLIFILALFNNYFSDKEKFLK